MVKSTTDARPRWMVGVLVLLVVLFATGTALADVRPPGGAVSSADSTSAEIRPSLPSNLDSTRAAEMWRDIAGGDTGTVSIPDKKAARLIQTNGMEWLTFRTEVIGFWGLVGVLVMLVGLSGFYMVRGRIRIDAGPAGEKIQRFKSFEVIGHWTTAVSFLLLAVTGLFMLYGRDYILPYMNAGLFAGISEANKYTHNFAGFVFMAGLLYIFVMWVRHNIWDRYDFNWILKGGGILSKGHPPAGKFNFGQKTVFWMVILVGLGLSVSGLNLLMPFWFVDDIETMQTIQLVHAGLGVGLFALMLAHIYIGSVGMEAAFDAMKSGWVDLNWAKEHHSAWVDDYLRERDPRSGDPPSDTAGKQQPAE